MYTLHFLIRGMHCDSCTKICTLKLRKLPGFQNVDIDLASGDATLDSSEPIGLAEVQSALSGTGYDAIAASDLAA